MWWSACAACGVLARKRPLPKAFPQARKMPRCLPRLLLSSAASGDLSHAWAAPTDWLREGARRRLSFAQRRSR